MSEPKAQLVDPQENMNLPGMNATGVITASSFSGEGGVVTGLTGGGNLNVGVVTATSFVGDGTGHAANLTGTPNLNLGLTTATSFIGDATGKAAGLTGTPNLNVGLITATSFAGAVTGDVTGNITGLAGSITPGNNLNVGVCTAIQYHGDGSNLTGAGSSASIAQEITANSGAETIIDLSYGNLIYYNGNANATVGFASTSPAEQITFIRNTANSYSTSYATAAVEFDGTDDALTLGATTDLELDGDFTIEWSSFRGVAGGMDAFGIGAYQVLGGMEMFFHSADKKVHIYTTDGSGGSNRLVSASTYAIDKWQHYALVRSGSTITLYFDGTSQGSWSSSLTFGPSGNNIFKIGCAQATAGAALITFWDGKISNFRVVKGTAVYTGNFIPPRKPLTNITNTKLLCCQSSSSATTAEVTPGTITAESSPTAASQTISPVSGTFNASSQSITWPSTVQWNNDTTPTLISNDYSKAVQIFHLTTGDTGASYQAWEEMENNTLQSYQLWTWGSNSDGMLGLNQEGNKYSSPVQVSGNWSELGNGNYGSQGNALIKFDKTLWMWGKNASGQLGLTQASGLELSSPTQVPGTTWANTSYAYRSIAAPKSDGTMWAWGLNSGGQLGQNNTTNQSSPCQIPGTDWGTDTQEIYNTTSTFAAIKTDGTMWTWGSGTWGQLGHNQAEAQLGGASSPIQVGTDTTWSAVNGGNSYFMATKTDGTLWGWGANSKGALGQNQGGTGPSQPARSSPVQLPGTTWSITGVANAVGVVNAFKTDGTFWTWGDNIKGALGLNQSGGTLDGLSSPTQLPGTTWSQTATMDDGGRVAVKTDGTLWSWGQAQAGQLGQNDGTERSSPTQVGTNTNWVDVKGAGTATMCAFRSS